MSLGAEAIVKVVGLNGGSLTGKTRLQKSLYFLEVLDCGFGFEFEYHHFGPFSDEVRSSTADAEAIGALRVENKQGSYGVPYAVYYADRVEASSESDTRRKNILIALSRYDAVAVELAATADFLRRNGYSDTAWDETVARKPRKATPERLDTAKRLLAEIGSVH